jgi:cytochrome b subunit of formate dehydrogenase
MALPGGHVPEGASLAEPPSCTGCHGAHGILARSDTLFEATMVERCSHCHEHYAESFYDSYHGQASGLGSEDAATCQDCHGSHGVLGAEDPNSMVGEAHLLETCQSCHPEATAGFALFQPHADHNDREQYPYVYWSYHLMTALLIGVFTVFGAHTVLWLLRLAFDALRGTPHGARHDAGDWAMTAQSQESPLHLDSAQRGEGHFVWRFPAFHRWTHATVIVSFFLLVITGLPLRFSQAFWAPALMGLLGGVEMAGLLHRIGAVMTFGYFGLHLAYLVNKVARAPDPMKMLWGVDTLVPQPRDVVDFWNQIRWYFGRGPRPRFARYSYMEKFDYFAVFWGVAIIGGSGLLLWFPEFFARFMPGWIFNVATIVHADEALLASGFIFTIHFFHVHFRPEKFPLDAVMFTGRATREYMEEEHPLVLDRIDIHASEPPSLVQKPDTPAPTPSRAASLAAAALGFLALAVGMALTGMILWAVILY